MCSGGGGGQNASKIKNKMAPERNSMLDFIGVYAENKTGAFEGIFLNYTH